MLNTIKSKIIFAFSSIIFVFIIIISAVSIVNVNLTNQYKKIEYNIAKEQLLRDSVWNLVEISYRSFNNNDYSLYYKELETIDNIKKDLDLIFSSEDVDKETKLSYRSVKNSLNIVIDSVEKTKLDLIEYGGIIGVSQSYQDTVSKFEFVKQNITNLLLLETKNITKATEKVNESQKILLIWIFYIIFLVIIIVIISIIIFLKSIIKPIKYLSEISQKISVGDLSIKIDEKLINTDNELGYLSLAFKSMIEKLKEKIDALDLSSEKIKKTNLDLENSKKAILNILEDVENEKDNAENMAGDLKKFKLAVENASDQIIITDPEGIVIFGNKSVEKITGYTPEEAMGKKAGILWKTPMPKEYYENMWDVIKIQKKTFNGEIQNRRKSGELYIATLSISSVLDKEGTIIYFVAIQRDITKEKEVDKAKTEFVSLASHQLRTPLSAINWYTEMLLAGDAGVVSEEQKKFLEEIAIGNKRMVDLVDDLLNVSRLDMGTFTIDTKPINVLDLVKNVLNEARVQILNKKLIVEESYSENIPTFLADEKLIRMIFQNLLSNAIKYTKPETNIKMSLRVVNKDDNFGEKIMSENSLGFEVSDSGMGIPLRQQDKIFTKLFRADNAKESETEGTGLGLYVIKSIVDQSGGQVWFKSEENKGSTFYVTFPIDGMKIKEKNKNSQNLLI